MMQFMYLSRVYREESCSFLEAWFFWASWEALKKSYSSTHQQLQQNLVQLQAQLLPCAPSCPEAPKSFDMIQSNLVV